jgi:hypothetical protein
VANHSADKGNSGAKQGNGQSAVPSAAKNLPSHIIVDPCAAITDYIKEQVPAGAPQPVFSSMALVHGENAVGARALKKGFAWNSGMDLAWALGFPYLRFIVDGYPVEDTRAALAAAFDPDDVLAKMRRAKWRSVIGRHIVVQPRRGAMAVIHEGAVFENPLRAADEEFQELTAPRGIDGAEARDMFRKRAAQAPDPDVLAFYLEALIGPDAVAEGLMSLVDDPVESPFGNKPTVSAVYALIPISRRLEPRHHDDIVKRLGGRLAELRTAGRPEGTEEGHEWANLHDALSVFCEPEQNAKQDIAAGKPEYGLFSAKWVDGAPELTTQCLEAQTDVPDVPKSRYCFTGSERVLELAAERFSKYDASDVLGKYVNDYTTIQSPHLLGPILELSATQRGRPMIQAWLRARGTSVEPDLQRLARGSDKLAKLAQAALKLVG